MKQKSSLAPICLIFVLNSGKTFDAYRHLIQKVWFYSDKFNYPSEAKAERERALPKLCSWQVLADCMSRH